MYLRRRDFLEGMLACSAIALPGASLANASGNDIDCVNSLVLFDPAHTAGELFAAACGSNRQSLQTFIESPDTVLSSSHERVIGLSFDADALIAGTLLSARGFEQTHRAEHVKTDAGVLHRLDSCNNSTESALAVGEAAALWPGLLARALMGERSHNPQFIRLNGTVRQLDIPLVSWGWERTNT